MTRIMRENATAKPIPRPAPAETCPRFESALRAVGCVIGRAVMVGSNESKESRSGLEDAIADVLSSEILIVIPH
jgi:hypothetical protein